MKGYLFSLAFLTVLSVSCHSGMQDIDEAGMPAPEIFAEVEVSPSTKTLLSVNGEGVGTIYWTPADEINIFYGTKSAHYSSTNTANVTSASFTTGDTIGAGDSESSNIWGLYPYDPDAYCDGSSVFTTLPAVQRAVPETFDDDLYIMLAHSDSPVLKFYNVCGGVKFSLSRADITSVTFRGNNGEYIAGDISLTFEDGLPKATVVNGVKEITVTPKKGHRFAKGANYYIVVLPGTLSEGFTMTFTTDGGGTASLNYTDNPVTIKRSIFSKKEDIDLWPEFTVPKVLFLGNSLTWHGIVDYWWGEWGMAATKRENDYVHKFMDKYKENDPEATYIALNIANWERNFNISKSELFSPAYNFGTDTDLLIFRIGENVTVESAFENALVSLVNYVSALAPNAKKIISGQFWGEADTVKEVACINAASRTGATYVQLYQYGNSAYEERIGNYVWGDDGMQHSIFHSGVAGHPSDAGMQAIADELYDAYITPPDPPEEQE